MLESFMSIGLHLVSSVGITCELFNVQDCVMTALREKTVILVTHQVEFLSEVDNILVIRG